MYSVRKTRSLSICLLMVLSALGPISTVVADHEEEEWPDEGPYIELWIELDGSWEELALYHLNELESGTYEMQVYYQNLDVGSNYTLSWWFLGINEDQGELTGNVTSDNMSETWQMEVSEFDCGFNIDVAIVNMTDGMHDVQAWAPYDFYGECMEYGTVTYSADIGGNWVSEPDEMDVGDYDMRWDVTNLTTGGEYKLDYWYYLSGQRIEFGQDMTGYGYEWVATGTEEAIDWNVSISDTDCTLQPESMLWENTSSGWTVVDQYWIGQWSEVVLLPCEPMLTLRWFNNDTGSWEELENGNSNGWASAGIYEGLDSCQEIEEEDEGGWECTDDDGNTETWDACNEWEEEYWCWNYSEVLFLEPGDYDFELVISHLEVGGSYMLNYHWYHHGYFGESWEDENLEFTAPSDTLTLNQTLTIEPSTCSERLEVFLDQNVTDSSGSWGHYPLAEGYWMAEGPCEEPPSPFTLYTDGVEHEQIVQYMEYDECEDSDDEPGALECWMDDWDWDGDGEPDMRDWFDDEQCEENANGTWWCEMWYHDPSIEEGNHSMELEVEDLEVGESYYVSFGFSVNMAMSESNSDWFGEVFNASSAEESFNFFMETDNFTCNAHVFASLYTVDWDESGNLYETGAIGEDDFNYFGPCEMPPSPFILWIDGVAFERLIHYDEFDECEETEEDGDYFECWMDDWDWDGDGEPDHWDWRDNCEEDANGTWLCEGWHEDPSIEEGNHSVNLEMFDLEEDESYQIRFSWQVYQMMGEGESYEFEGVFNASSSEYEESLHGLFGAENFFMETDNFTCGVTIYATLSHVDWDEDGNWWETSHIYNEWFNYNGPCEMPPSPFTLYADGVEWEPIQHYDEFDECEESGDEPGTFECWMDDWDYDGDGAPDHWDWREDCEEQTDGTWLCESWQENPSLEEGDHSMELEVEDLEVDDTYTLEIKAEVCHRFDCDVEEIFEVFNASSDMESFSFSMETDNFTCHANVHASLRAVDWDEDGNWWEAEHIYNDGWGYDGPCEEPPSPFTLYADGVEHEQIVHYMEYDECEDSDDEPGALECWMDDWDWDGDGEPDHWDWFDDEQCEEDANGTWWCEMWYEDPLIGAGNHSMTLEIEDLEEGANYSLWIEIYQNGQGWSDYEYGDEDFTATSDFYSTSGEIETSNFTCNLNIGVRLAENHTDEEGNSWHSQIAWGYFNYNGPCETPPSPFTLYADGVEYGPIQHYDEFDECEETEEEGDYFECWMDDWDGDGDGEPDWTDWRDNCEEQADGTWLCESWQERPSLDEGNHSMELEVEDLEAGENYAVAIESSICADMVGCEYDWFDELFVPSSSDMESVNFFIETDNFTCSVNLYVSLHEAEQDEDGNWWHTQYIAGDWFNYNGPCEKPPSPIHLIYTDENGDEVEWEPVTEMHEYDWCDDYGDHFECWDDDEGDEMFWEDYCEEQADGTWLCESEGGSPSIGEGDNDMMWSVDVDLEEEEDYTLSWQVYSMSMLGYDWYEEMANFTATSDTHEIDWTLYVDNSTCDVQISVNLMIPHDWDDDGITDDYDYVYGDNFGFHAPCEVSFPVDIGLQVDDGGWEDVEGVPLDLIFSEEEYEEDDEIGLILDNIGYELDAGDWDMQWTFDGLMVGDNYSMFYVAEHDVGPDGGGEGATFVCGDGEEIPFDWVNDGWEDCEDGSDEPQDFDGDGESDNWFDCSDGTEIPMEDVNDGEDDCPDGEDEAGSGGDYVEGEYSWNASAESEEVSWTLEVHEDTCIIIVQAQVMQMEEIDYDGDGYPDDVYQHMMGLYVGVIAGPELAHDDNGNGIPDCMEFDDDGPDGPDGEGFDPMMFAYGVQYSVGFYGTYDGIAEVYVEQMIYLEDDIREKIDADFGDGDGYLNQTEADEVALAWSMGYAENEDDDSPDGMTLNGHEPLGNDSMGLFIVNLASDSTEDVMMGVGWVLYFDAADEEDDFTLSFEGDEDDEGEDFPFSSTVCAFSDGDYTLVYAEINGTVVTEIDGTGVYDSHCFELEEEEDIPPFTVTWGILWVDSDGDGVHDDHDDFPNDANETTDTDEDGVGDNADRFPEDPDEWSDMDDDGVGDNSDVFPYDPAEWADTDGDGWGDNIDTFPEDGTEWIDTDGDGIGDNADTDADGDGINDDAEDSDGDGVNDDEDDFPFDENETTDSDGDGVGDNADDFPDDANETTDTDGDGIGDNSDEDADGDGQPNDIDDFPLNSEESSDSDGDGVGDNQDAFPNDPNEDTDTDDDGIGDGADTDDDGDGVEDEDDAFPLDPDETTDTDSDGLGDNADAFPEDPYERYDNDNDGVGDNSDVFPSNPNEWADADADGTGDNSDTFPNDPNEIADSDGDGVGNNADVFPYDGTEWADDDDNGVGDNTDAANAEEEAIEDADGGGLFGLPGFSASLSLVSMLGAAILIAGRRKD